MKNRQATLVLTSMSLIATSSPSVSAAERMKGGMWEVTTTENGKDLVKTRCFTPEGKNPNGTEQEIRTDLETDAASARCTIQDFALKGDTISYTFACQDGSTTDSTTYHGDTYESVMTSRSSTGNHTRHIKGRRLGDCPSTAIVQAPVGDAKVNALEASIDRALTAYNRQDPKAFYAEWTSAFRLPAFTDYYVDSMKQLGSYVSRRMVKDDSVLEGAAPLVVYEAKFAKASKVKITVHFTKDGASTKIMNIELDKM